MTRTRRAVPAESQRANPREDIVDRAGIACGVSAHKSQVGVEDARAGVGGMGVLALNPRPIVSPRAAHQRPARFADFASHYSARPNFFSLVFGEAPWCTAHSESADTTPSGERYSRMGGRLPTRMWRAIFVRRRSR